MQISLSDLMAYTDWERQKWRRGYRSMATRSWGWAPDPTGTAELTGLKALRLHPGFAH
jgi:hypothetical protein